MPFFENLFLLAEHDNVQTDFFRLQQFVLTEYVRLAVVSPCLQPVQFIARGIQAGEVETLRNDEFADCFVFGPLLPRGERRTR